MSSSTASAWWVVPGIVVFAVGIWMVSTDVEKWNAVWYLPAWYGYLLVIDGWIFRLQGHSFVAGRGRELGAMLFWSIPFWFLFEAYDFAIQNWYYVFVPQSEWARIVKSVLAFATVFPACFFHAELLGAAGFFKGIRWRPLRVGRRLQVGLVVVGILSIVLPVLYPRYAFWMVWGVTLWVPDVLNYRAGAPSLLGDLSRGRPGRTVRLLVGGLWAGVIWEGLNYWGRCKWIYTVPGLEDWKIFEMPWLGFLGFPLLSLQAFTAYSLICHWLREGRHWESGPGRVGVRLPKPSRFRYWAATVLAVAFCVAVFEIGQDRNVRSRRPLLEELEGMDARSVRRLREIGVPTPERLVAEVDQDGVGDVATRSGLAASDLRRAHDHALLALHKGMGTEAAGVLRQVGVETVSDLTRWDAERLHGRLVALGEGTGRVPRLSEVKVWWRAADSSGRPRR